MPYLSTANDLATGDSGNKLSQELRMAVAKDQACDTGGSYANMRPCDTQGTPMWDPVTHKA